MVQGNYDADTGFQGVSQEFLDYDLIEPIGSDTFKAKHKEHGYIVLCKWIGDTFCARKVDDAE